MRQESELLQRMSGVAVVFGTAASGLEEVPVVLRERLPDSCTVLSGLRAASAFWSEVEKLGRPKRDMVTLVIADPTCHWTEDWVWDAAEKTERMRGRESWQRFVFLADPSKTWQLVSQPDGLAKLEHRNAARLTLEPWHQRALRLWIEDLDRTESAVTACLAGLRDLTGLWHGPLYALRDHLVSIPAGEWPTILETVAGMWEAEDRKDELRTSFGLVAYGANLVALRVLAQFEKATASEIAAVAEGAPLALIETGPVGRTCSDWRTRVAGRSGSLIDLLLVCSPEWPQAADKAYATGASRSS